MSAPETLEYLDMSSQRDSASKEQAHQLWLRLDALDTRIRRRREDAAQFESLIATIGYKPRLAGYATREGVSRFAARFGKDCVGFYRAAQDIVISSLGIGTNRGAMDS